MYSVLVFLPVNLELYKTAYTCPVFLLRRVFIPSSSFSSFRTFKSGFSSKNFLLFSLVYKSVDTSIIPSSYINLTFFNSYSFLSSLWSFSCFCTLKLIEGNSICCWVMSWSLERVGSFKMSWLDLMPLFP